MQLTVIERIDPVAEDVVALTLRGADGPLAPWEPGAHIDLALPNWLTRQYSLCGDPADRERYRVAVRHDRLSRGGSEYVHLFLRAGRTMKISLPRNTFPLEPAPSYLFLAGGIGITAILPMMRAVPEASLLYIGQNEKTMPFTDELRAAHGDRVTIVATGRDGRPDLTALAERLDPGTAVYCCGPAAMLDACDEIFPPERLHLERFRPAPKTFAPDTPFEVTCARSGETVPVAAGETMLDALRDAGHPVPAGCREGVCGSCDIRVVAGKPEHRDDIGAAPGHMYPCVSRALSPKLVVDL